MEKEYLSKRDRDCLIWVAEQYTVNLHDFIQVLNAHPETCRQISYDGGRKRVARLKQRGILETKRIVWDRPLFLYLTRKGLNALHLSYPDYEPRDYIANEDGLDTGVTIYHTDYINKARLYLEGKYGLQVAFQSERNLRQAHRAECTTFGYIPEALPENKYTAIEVEHSDKGEDRLESILLDRMLHYEQTLYFCTRPHVYRLVRRKTREVDPGQQHFQVYDWSFLN